MCKTFSAANQIAHMAKKNICVFQAEKKTKYGRPELHFILSKYFIQ